MEETNKTNISKNKKRKKSKLAQLIKSNKKNLFIIALICVIAYTVFIVIQLVKNPTDTFVVEYGQVFEEEIAEGYIIRDEEVVKGKNYKNGMSQIKTEGEKVAKGEAVFRYYSNGEDSLIKKIEELDKKINEAMADENNLGSGDAKVLDDQITEKLNLIYNESDLEKIKEYKREINTNITKKAKIVGEYSPSGSYLKKLIDERNGYENSLNEGAEYVKAPKSGVVSYRVDGYESALTTSDFGNITEEFLEGLNLKTGQIVATNNESGKIVDNYKCYIACILNSEDAKQAEIGQKVQFKLPSGNEVEAEIEYISMQDNNKYLIVFKIQKCVEELVSYRKVSFHIIWWSHTGKKIPNSAIHYEQKGEEQVAYVIRTRAGYQDKIWVKELKSNGKYTIVEDYTSEELQELGYTSEEISGRKKISLYDEILLNA